jgi:23S rRNA (adenine-N6)-dimethyltransferase
VARSTITAADAVVEIGAGRGALTRELLRRAGHVTAVEIDPASCAALARELGSEARLSIAQADFRSWPLPCAPYKVFANIPFAHTAAIVRRLTEAANPPTDAYLIVEDGAARRFAGAPYAKETLRSLLLKPGWQVEIAEELRAEEFDPPPDARCALLWAARRTRPLLEPALAALWGDFVAASRAGAPGSVRAALRGLLSREQLARQARLLRFERDGPITALGFEQWLGLFRAFVRVAGPAARGHVRGALRRLAR